jgi:hypothetical protein
MAAMTKNLHIRLVTEPSELSRYEAEWRKLLDASRFSEPMLDPFMAADLVEILRRRKEPAELLFDGDRLLSIAPLCRRLHFYRPGIPFRRLEFLGSDAKQKNDVYSEYLGLITLPGYEAVAAAKFVEKLKQNGFGGWDECSFEMMNGEDPATTFLFDELSRGTFLVERTVQTEALYLTLPKNWDLYLSSVHGKRRNWFRRTMRDFEAWVGDRGYALHRATDDTSLRQGFDILANLHEERWQASGKTGAFHDPRFRDFHKDYTSQILAAGKLELIWLTVGDEPVAAMYNILGKNKIYFYQSGRRMGVPAHVRIGIVMFVLSLQVMKYGLRRVRFSWRGHRL